MHQHQQDPVLSVVMTSYNHEPFIEQALRGVLMQECDFDVEVLISDDASTDGTSATIAKVIAAYRGGMTIRVLKRESNLGMMRNFVSTLHATKGEFIAICEGDDYWTDASKLQRQVDFLRSDPGFAICFHEMSIAQDGELRDDPLTRGAPTISSIEELSHGNFIHTPSVVLRNDVLLPDWFTDLSVGDYPLYLLSLQGRKIKKLARTMAVYRLHDTSHWMAKSVAYRDKRWIRTLTTLLGHVDAAARPLLQKQVERAIVRLLTHCASELKATEKRDLLMELVSLDPAHADVFAELHATEQELRRFRSIKHLFGCLIRRLTARATPP